MILVEREAALTQLSNLFAESCRGHERVAVITAAPACGKTELLQAFYQSLPSGSAIYCQATASRLERDLRLGVISQIFHNAELPQEIRDRANLLLEAEAMHAHSPGIGLGAGSNVSPHIMHALGTLLLDLARGDERPIVISVDDAQHADLPSLICLVSTINRLRRARVMVLISASPGTRPLDPLFVADLPPIPYTRNIQLDLLTIDGIKRLLRERLSSEEVEQLADECFRLSGGNPALVRALIEDYHLHPGHSLGHQLTIGAGTRRTVQQIVHRCDPLMLGLARSIAILEDSSGSFMAGRLAELDNESAARALTVLNRTGVLSNGRFRHPELRAAVLDGLTPDERAAMHSRAAECLRAEGIPAYQTARHLLAAEKSEITWATPVLHEAAEQALSHGRIASALDYLKLAHRISQSDSQRTAAASALARAEWRLDPAVSMRHYAEVVTNLDATRLVEHDALAWVKRLMWFGRAAEARKLLRQVEEASGNLDSSATTQIPALRRLLTTLFPVSGESSSLTLKSVETSTESVTVNSMSQPLSLLMSALGGDAIQAPTAAEHVLQETRLSERTFALLAGALTSLIYSGRLHIADSWCDSLRNDAIVQRVATWEAIFTALRSATALRLGNLTASVTWARKALTIIPASSWGIGISIPLSLLVQASTSMGKYDDVLDHLRIRVPDEVFETPLGLLYLQARGQFHYARRNYGAALNHFETIGNLAVQWGVDLPAWVSWRTDVASTLLQLGQNQMASDLITEQIKKLTPCQTRERGISLRVLAACGELPKRPGRLIQSAKELQECRNRLELAYTLADLGQAYHDLGHITQARNISRSAYRIAKQCGATPLCESIVPSSDGGSSAHVDADNGHDAGSPYNGLSKAERRVAALAADGYSNREIASKLFITASTVEQHLTRVYSKLKVKRRTDLPTDLYPMQATKYTSPGESSELCTEDASVATGKMLLFDHYRGY